MLRKNRKEKNMDKQTRKALIILAALFTAGTFLGVTLGMILAHALTGDKHTEVWMPQVEYIEETAEKDQDVLLDAGPQIVRHQLGEFKLTAYCPCEKCNGKWVGEPTASGAELTVGRTIAVDPEIIPLGSVVDINGFEYIAEDTGSAIKGNRIDILFPNHEDALDFGVQFANVSIIYKNL